MLSAVRVRVGDQEKKEEKTSHFGRSDGSRFLYGPKRVTDCFSFDLYYWIIRIVGMEISVFFERRHI